MRILHIGLGSHFTENMTYQDNVLTEMNAKQGHSVVYVADCYIYRDCRIEYVGEEDRVLDNGVRMIRIDYDHIINEFVSDRIRKSRKLKRLLLQIHPETIMFHGLLSYELITVAEYSKEKNIPLYADCHADYFNTARTSFSKLVYKIVYKPIIWKSLAEIKKILYVGKGTRQFLQDLYKIPEEKLEFYPLGGILQSKIKQKQCKEKLIADLNLSDDVIICTHSGKLTKEKRTKDLMEAFISVQNTRLCLIILGSVPDEEYADFMELVKSDKRIHFLGWKKEKEMADILCATDLYLQPGSQSSTAQMALCCGCAEAVFPTESYKELYGNNVIYISCKKNIKTVFHRALTEENYLQYYKETGYNLAKDILDYEKLAMRYLR